MVLTFFAHFAHTRVFIVSKVCGHKPNELALSVLMMRHVLQIVFICPYVDVFWVAPSPPHPVVRRRYKQTPPFIVRVRVRIGLFVFHMHSNTQSVHARASMVINWVDDDCDCDDDNDDMLCLRPIVRRSCEQRGRHGVLISVSACNAPIRVCRSREPYA